jgi:ankyrin repeat protein
METITPSDIITSKSCINNLYQCNEFTYNIDDVLNYEGDYNEQTQLAQYLNKTKDCELTHCCDDSIDNYYLLSNSIKNKYYKINTETNKIISLSEYNALNKNEMNKYRCPTSYDICKYGLNKDIPICPKSMCSNLKNYRYPFKSYEIDLNLIDFQKKLIEVIKEDDVVTLQNLLSHVYDINQPLLVSYPGNTLIFDSIMYDANNCTLFLLKENPKLNLQNKNGNTALNIACLKGNNTIINSLLKFGNDITIRNNLGENALMCAIRSGNYDCVIQILNKGGSINIKNKKDENPLFIAVTTPIKNFSIINMLVDMGCDILEKNTDSKSMLKILNEDYKNTDIGKQISTLLINTIIKLKGDKYYMVINEMPEFSIIDYKHTPVLLNEGDIEVTLPNAYTVPISETYNPKQQKYPQRRKTGIDISAIQNNKINNDTNNIKEDFSTAATETANKVVVDYSFMEFVLGVLIILMGIAFTFYLIRK